MGRSRWILAPMMTLLLLLLPGCGGKGQGGDRVEERALAIRGEYLEMDDCAATCTVTADYGQRVYEFAYALTVQGEEVTLALTAPQELAGATVRLSGKEGRLEIEGAMLETGTLDEEGLTPVSAVPALLEAAKSGFMDIYALEDVGVGQALRVECRDPEQQPGTGREIVLWFQPDTGALLRGEISSDGRRVIDCQFTDFTKD